MKEKLQIIYLSSFRNYLSIFGIGNNDPLSNSRFFLGNDPLTLLHPQTVAVIPGTMCSTTGTIAAAFLGGFPLGTFSEKRNRKRNNKCNHTTEPKIHINTSHSRIDIDNSRRVFEAGFAQGFNDLIGVVAVP